MGAARAEGLFRHLQTGFSEEAPYWQQSGYNDQDHPFHSFLYTLVHVSPRMIDRAALPNEPTCSYITLRSLEEPPRPSRLPPPLGRLCRLALLHILQTFLHGMCAGRSSSGSDRGCDTVLQGAPEPGRL